MEIPTVRSRQMTYFLFIYSIFLTLIFGACNFGFLALYVKRRNRRDLWISILFFIYTLDNLLYSMAEIIPAFHDFYIRHIITTPFPRNILSLLIIFVYMIIAAYFFGRPPSVRDKAVLIVSAAAALISTGYSEFLWGRLVFRTAALLLHVYIFAFIFVNLQKTDKFSDRQLKISKLAACIVAAFQLLGSAQWFYIILSEDSMTAGGRILGHELVGLFFAAAGIWYLFRVFSRPERELSEEELISLFCAKYKLTAREADLIPLLLKGAQNSQICEELCIALNTVKVHTHNIYQKLEIERRGQLSAKFSLFCENYIPRK